MRMHQQQAMRLEHLAEHYKGNPVINGRHAIARIHDENPDMVFPQIPKLMKLTPVHQMDESGGFERQQASLAATSSHTSPEEVLSLSPEALLEFIVEEDNKREINRPQVARLLRRKFGYKDTSFLEGGFCFPTIGVAGEENPLVTPRESLFRDFKNGAFTGKIDIKSSDWDAYVLNHEVGHRRADKRGMRTSKELPDAGNAAGYEKLRSKQQQVHFSEGGQDIYGIYLEESFCDTFAVLQHLKNGGDPAFIQTLSDVRENDVVNNEWAYKYHTHTSLKAVAKNSETLQKRLAGANNEEIEEMAAGIVGERSYNREEYYQHAFVALSQNHKNKFGREADSIDWNTLIDNNKMSAAKALWKDYTAGRHQAHPSGQKKGFWSGLYNNKQAFETPKQFIDRAVDKYGKQDEKNRLKAEKRLTDVPETTPEERNAEVLGQLKYVMSKHPEKTPDLLLREREAYLKQKSRETQIGIPQDMRDANDQLHAHCAEKRAASVARAHDNKKQKVGEITKDQHPPEPEQTHGAPYHGLERS